MKIKLILIIVFCVLLIGCTQYSEGTFQTHSCNAPYTYNLSCNLARACYVNQDLFNPILETYMLEECSKNLENKSSCETACNSMYNETHVLCKTECVEEGRIILK